MRHLIVLDPGMDALVGHHLSANVELARTARELGFTCTFAAGADVDSRYPDLLGWPVQAVFTNGPYRRIENVAALDALLHQQQEVVEQYWGLDIPDGACVLMHTPSPWHLQALADRLESAQVRSAVCLMLPTSFWSTDSSVQCRLNDMATNALRRLREGGGVSFAEVPGPFGDDAIFLPLSSGTLAKIDRWTATERMQSTARPRFGYFGRPYGPKGFDVIVDALCGVTVNPDIQFFLPEGYVAVADELRERFPGVQASSVFRSNDRYFADMASVDVVLCAYDPSAYACQMSGVVMEAALSGKATVATHGTALARFVGTHAPDSYRLVDFSASSIREAFADDDQAWRIRQRNAASHRESVRRLRTGAYFFSRAFGSSV
ncbi:MAG TPA: hypothetical protein VN700_11665 [Vicinamibacterales bacterium]|nr:hypothetical protein [Vicinamibacterales bacterium]